MKIQQADIGLSAQHSYAQQYSRQESFNLSFSSGSRSADRVSLSDLGKRMSASVADETAATEKTDKSRGDEAWENDPKLRLIKMTIEALTGKEIKLVNLDLQGSISQQASVSASSQFSQGGQAQPSAGFSAEFSSHESYHEMESLQFQAHGVVQTSDGQQLEFQLDFSLQREFSIESDTALKLGDAAKRKDPLVINMDVPAAKLLDNKFKFDLDNDGKAENISALAPGSAFLALDKNKDGKINHGGELFGARTGNGFAELAEHDQDHNHWIDQNDAVFDKLRLWLKGADGKDLLLSLKDANIGAIFLGNVKSDFKLANVDNQTQGDIRSTGLYLKENGQAATVQQVDLAV